VLNQRHMCHQSIGDLLIGAAGSCRLSDLEHVVHTLRNAMQRSCNARNTIRS